MEEIVKMAAYGISVVTGVCTFIWLVAWSSKRFGIEGVYKVTTIGIVAGAFGGLVIGGIGAGIIVSIEGTSTSTANNFAVIVGICSIIGAIVGLVYGIKERLKY